MRPQSGFTLFVLHQSLFSPMLETVELNTDP